MKNNQLAIVGAPSSAGAYGPGQEKTPNALRDIGLISFLKEEGVKVNDTKDVPGYRWKIDKENKRAMNVDQVYSVAKRVAEKVHESLEENDNVLVLGGDCTIELGVVAGCLESSENIGLLYFDLDTDLNTPLSVNDGALDWMGLAHLLDIAGTNKKLASIGRKTPMLRPDQVYLFANGNMTEFEQEVINSFKLREIGWQEVAEDPVKAAKKVRETWAHQFDRILIHLDLDVLDYVDMQLAENYRRNIGLTFDQLMLALDELLQLPNWSVLTVTEINPEHGEADGSTLKAFAKRLAESLGRGLSKRNQEHQQH
jgi:arginase